MSYLDLIYRLEQSNSAKLDQILDILKGPPIAGAEVGAWQEKTTMQKTRVLKAAVGDFQLQDNGTATAPIGFVDSVGEPAVLQSGATVSTSLTSSDPNLTPTVDSTGLIITVTPSLATPLPALPILDITITATVTVTNPDASTIGPFTAVSDGIDLVAGGPAGAQIGPIS